MGFDDTALLDESAHVFFVTAVETWHGDGKFLGELLLEIIADFNGDLLIGGLGYEISGEEL